VRTNPRPLQVEPQSTAALNCHKLQTVTLIECLLLLRLLLLLLLLGLLLLLVLLLLLLPRCRTACAEAVHVLDLYCCVASSARRLLYCMCAAAATSLCAGTDAVYGSALRYCFQRRMQAAAVLLLLKLVLPGGLLLLVHVLV
jgi:hypothetical protein